MHRMIRVTVLCLAVFLVASCAARNGQSRTQGRTSDSTQTQTRRPADQVGTGGSQAHTRDWSAQPRYGLHVPGTPMAARNAGVSMIRRIVPWDLIEPQKGQFRWEEAGEFVRRYQSEGLDLVMTLSSNNMNWGSTWRADPAQMPDAVYGRKSSMPVRMDDWRNYVRSVVEKMDGDGKDDLPGLLRPVRHWQIENEFIFQWQGTTDEFIELIRVTSETIREADPNAVIISPAFFNVLAFAVRDGISERGWFYAGTADARRRKLTAEQLASQPDDNQTFASEVLRRAHPYFDVVDLHVYVMDADEIRWCVEWIQKELRSAGASKSIWSLEFATPFHEFTEERFNRDVITSPIIGFEAGIDRIFWNSIMPTTPHQCFQRLSLYTESAKPKKAYQNFAAAARVLGGFTSVERVSVSESAHLYRFTFPDNSRQVWVGWTDGGTVNTTIRTSEPLRARTIGIQSSDRIGPEEVLNPSGGAVKVRLTAAPTFFATR